MFEQFAVVRTDSFPEVNRVVSHDVADPADRDDVKAGVPHQRLQLDPKGLDHRDGTGDNRRHEDTSAD